MGKLGLGIFLLAALLLPGCATVNAEDTHLMDVQIDVGCSNITKWKTLSDAQKEEAHFEAIRSLSIVRQSATGKALPAEVATDPFDKSATPPKCPEDARADIRSHGEMSAVAIRWADGGALGPGLPIGTVMIQAAEDFWISAGPVGGVPVWKHVRVFSEPERRDLDPAGIAPAHGDGR